MAFRDELKVDPHSPAAYYGLGQIAYQRRDLSAALEDSNHSIQEKPDFGDAYVLMGQIEIDLGNEQKAREVLERGAELIEPQRDAGDQVFCAALSPDGGVLAVALATGAKLFDAVTGRERRALTDEFTGTIAVSPDGKTVATGHAKTVKLWEAASGKKLATLEGHAKNCFSLAFSPRGKYLAKAMFSLEAKGERMLPRYRGSFPIAQRPRLLNAAAFNTGRP